MNSNLIYHPLYCHEDLTEVYKQWQEEEEIYNSQHNVPSTQKELEHG